MPDQRSGCPTAGSTGTRRHSPRRCATSSTPSLRRSRSPRRPGSIRIPIIGRSVERLLGWRSDAADAPGLPGLAHLLGRSRGPRPAAARPRRHGRPGRSRTATGPWAASPASSTRWPTIWSPSSRRPCSPTMRSSGSSSRRPDDRATGLRRAVRPRAGSVAGRLELVRAAQARHGGRQPAATPLCFGLGPGLRHRAPRPSTGPRSPIGCWPPTARPGRSRSAGRRAADCRTSSRRSCAAPGHAGRSRQASIWWC